MYRIYTEDKGYVGRARVARVLTAHKIGATIYQAQGYWRDVAEDALIVDLDNISHATAIAIALDIKSELAQEAVLVVELQSTSTVV